MTSKHTQNVKRSTRRKYTQFCELKKEKVATPFQRLTTPLRHIVYALWP